MCGTFFSIITVESSNNSHTLITTDITHSRDNPKIHILSSLPSSQQRYPMLLRVLSALALLGGVLGGNEQTDDFGQLRVLLLSPGYPWQFGAYQNQQALLGVELQSRGYDVYWNSAFRQMGGNTKAFGAVEIVKADKQDNPPPMPRGKQLQRAKLFTYIGVPLPEAYQRRGKGVLASAVNDQLVRHSIDAIVCLLDANQILMDVQFAVYSIMWFPNHFTKLNVPQENTLKEFDVVASLAPTDAKMLQNSEYKLKQVELIPHIIERPPDLTTMSLKALRKKYRVPKKAWVIFVNCGNYEGNNRKSLDTILLAFKALLEEIPPAFLYLKAVSSNEILSDDGYVPNWTTEAAGLPILDMIHTVDIPAASYTLQTEILGANAAWELAMLANTLLMPSKSEGFGLPMLEAQLMGVPVVTTEFGAMKDYTIYGVAVPPSQPIYLSAGLAMMPDLYAVIEALKKIYRGELSSSLADEAHEFITSNLSSQSVGQKFDNLIRNGVHSKTMDTMFHKQATEKNSPLSHDDGDDESEGHWFFSLPYQDQNLYEKYLNLPPSSKPMWTLLWSNRTTLDMESLNMIRDQGWGTKIPPKNGDVLFLLTERLDGTSFPLDEDLAKGIIDPDAVILVHTDRFVAATKYMATESSRNRKTPTATDALRATLAQKAPINRPISMKVNHIVVARFKQVEARSRQEL